jgi:hypothetical protein
MVPAVELPAAESLVDEMVAVPGRARGAVSPTVPSAICETRFHHFHDHRRTKTDPFSDQARQRCIYTALSPADMVPFDGRRAAVPSRGG